MKPLATNDHKRNCNNELVKETDYNKS